MVFFMHNKFIRSTEQLIKSREITLRMKKKENAGLGRIFRELRGLKILEDCGDYIIFKRILITLKDAGYFVSNKSIVRHFSSCVSPEDYAQDEKEFLLKDLRRVMFSEVSK